MKNALLGTAALALALSAGAASAQDVMTSGRNFDFKVDGFITTGLGYVDTDDGNDNVGFIRDMEVIFVFEMMADNGLTFGAEVQLEAGDNADDGRANVDEAFGYVKGSFGSVVFGEEDGAGDRYMGSGHISYVFTSPGDGTGWIFDFYAGDSGLAINDKGGDTGDSLKLSYYTPNFSGFEAGISYVPEPGDENGRQVSRDGQTNAFEIGAAYANTFGDFSVRIGGGYVTDTTPSADDDYAWAIGGKLGFAGFEAGVNYGSCGEGCNGGTDSTDTISGGLLYSTGPWTADVQYAQVLSGTNEDDYGIAGEVAYAVAPGVTAGASVEWGTDDSANRDSFAAGLWLGMNF